MTIMLMTPRFGKSKAALRDALATMPNQVEFADPSPFTLRFFTGADIEVGESFYVVMDHPRRSRFALITRRADDWRVA